MGYVGKIYLREMYSNESTKPLLEKSIEDYFSDWCNNFDALKLIGHSPKISSCQTINCAVIHTDQEWNYFERDFFLRAIKQFASSLFPLNPVKSQAVNRYLLNKGVKQLGISNLQENSFLENEMCNHARPALALFFTKISMGNYKTADEKKKNHLELAINELEAKIAKIKITNPSIRIKKNVIKFAALVEDCPKAKSNLRLRGLLLKALDQLLLSCLEQLKGYDPNTLNPEAYSCILPEHLMKKLRDLKKSAATYQENASIREKLLEKLKKKRQKIQTIDRKSDPSSPGQSSSSSVSLPASTPVPKPKVPLKKRVGCWTRLCLKLKAIWKKLFSSCYANRGK